MTNLGAFIQRLDAFGSRVCLQDAEAAYTFSGLIECIGVWLKRLDELRVVPGTVIAVRADYSLSAISLVLAVLSREAVIAFIPLETDATPYLIDARAAVLVDVNSNGSYTWVTLPYGTFHQLTATLAAEGSGGFIIFTSGSTGRPKAALHSVQRFLHKFRGPGRTFHTLGFLLFDHIAGIDTLFYTLSSGGTLVVTRRRDPKAILDLIESRRIQVLPTSPSFLRLLCATSDFDHDLTSLQIITYGAELMDATTLKRLNTRFPKAQIIQKYGTTEAGSPRTLSRGNDSLWLKIKSDTEWKVVDGVLWMRGVGTFVGYLNASSSTDSEGWYCTGDLVETDGEWIRFCGRDSDRITVGGEKVTPGEVERTILELDIVRDALVTGTPHALMGEVVTATVALVSGQTDPKEAIRRIRQHCQRRLPLFKVPVEIAVTAEPLTNARQKLRRRENR